MKNGSRGFRSGVFLTILLGMLTVAACTPRPQVCGLGKDFKLEAGRSRSYKGTLANDPRTHRLFDDLEARKHAGLKVIKEKLGLGPRRLDRIVVVPTDQPFPPMCKTTRRPQGTFEVITLPVHRYVNGSMDLDESLIHELTHAVLHQWLGSAHKRLPFWLQEGLALWAGGQLGSYLTINTNCALHSNMEVSALVVGLDTQDTSPKRDLEHVLAVEYLARTFGPQAVVELAHKLITSYPAKRALKEISAVPWPKLSRNMASFSRDYLEKALDKSGLELVIQARRDLDAGQHEAALSALQAVQKDHPDSLLMPAVLSYMGEAFRAGGRHKDAVQAFSTILTSHSKCYCLQTRSLHRMAQSLKDDGQVEEACRAWRRLLNEYPLREKYRQEFERELEQCGG